MLDMSAPRAKIAIAAIRVAEKQGWRDSSLSDIAREAGVSLIELRREFRGKPELLAAFTRLIDDAVLSAAAASPPAEGESPRDRLFDILMLRFDAMAPYKAGLRRIAEDLRASPGATLAHLTPAMQSQYWMLAAAGIDADGFRGALRVKAMTAVYARVAGVWLEDDDPGMARTMAALDSRLRRGESAARRFDAACGAAERMFGALRGAGGGRRSRPAPAEEPAAPPPAPEAPPAGMGA